MGCLGAFGQHRELVAHKGPFVSLIEKPQEILSQHLTRLERETVLHDASPPPHLIPIQRVKERPHRAQIVHSRKRVTCLDHSKHLVLKKTPQYERPHLLATIQEPRIGDCRHELPSNRFSLMCIHRVRSIMALSMLVTLPKYTGDPMMIASEATIFPATRETSSSSMLHSVFVKQRLLSRRLHPFRRTCAALSPDSGHLKPLHKNLQILHQPKTNQFQSGMTPPSPARPLGRSAPGRISSGS